MGHADESTTLKHYIYNTVGSTEMDYKVLDALENERVRKSDQKIISFPKSKKTENLDISTFPAL